MNILQTHNLSKHFGGVYAVNNLSLDFEMSKITGIVGPNGSGKSTLINLLSGLYKKDSGYLVVEGVKLDKLYEPYELLDYKISRTFQEVRLFEQMTVLDNLLVTLTERDVFGALFSTHTHLHLKQCEEILKQINLWEKRNELSVNLSYGQRKLLEIARVLAMDAKIIFLDEPFAGMFKEIIKEVVKIIKQMRQQGKTVVLIEHNMELIRELCDYLYVMDEGKLLAEGEPEKVLAERKAVEAYLGE